MSDYRETMKHVSMMTAAGLFELQRWTFSLFRVVGKPGPIPLAEKKEERRQNKKIKEK
jgi:hypothetical protein